MISDEKLGLRSSGLLMWIQKTSLINSLKDVLVWFFFFLSKHYFGCKLQMFTTRVISRIPICFQYFRMMEVRSKYDIEAM